MQPLYSHPKFFDIRYTGQKISGIVCVAMEMLYIAVLLYQYVQTVYSYLSHAGYKKFVISKGISSEVSISIYVLK